MDILKEKILVEIALLFVVMVALGVNGRKEYWKPTGLKCELMEEAYSIDTKSPAFSWYMNSDRDKAYQKKFQFVLAYSEKEMKKGNYLLNTGWCESNENTYVKIQGIEEILKDNSLYCWSVRLCDDAGNVSAFSDIQYFSTSVGNDWCGCNGIWNNDISEYVFLRTKFLFQPEKKVEKALLSVTALSPETTRQYVYNMYINNQYIGSGPARLNKDEINYNTYDVTEYLSEKNVIGAICYSNIDQAFLCQLTIHYEDGTKEIVLNSDRDKGKWKTLNGNEAYGLNQNMIGTSYYEAHAENINANKYPERWLEYSYDDSKWENVCVSKKLNKKDLTAYQTETMQRFEVLPANIEYRGNGHYFIDFGQEIVGGIVIDSVGINKNAEMLLCFGEELEEDGTVKYMMRTGNVYKEKWQLKIGRQKFENLGMKTFRYVDIYCSHAFVLPNAIKGMEIRQPFDDEAAMLQSSNELLNDIYNMTKYTIKVTSQNLYVDSQSREREAYEGDVLINQLASYTFSDKYTLARVSAEYLYDNRTWPAEYPMYAIISAWEDYMYTGNVDSLNENYQYFTNHINDLILDEKCGLIKNNYKEDGFNRPLVDWPETERDGYAYDEVEYNTVVNAVVCVALEDMEKIAKVLGDLDAAENYSKQHKKLEESIIKKLYNSEKGAFSDGLDRNYVMVEHYSQHASVYALYAGIYKDDNMKEKLVKKITDSFSIKMSVFGAYFMLKGLYNCDEGEIATKLMLKEDAEDDHTWAYMIKQNNATISAEAWSSRVKDNMTFSHPWGSSPANLISSGIFGIEPKEAGFNSFMVKLQPGGIDSASITMPTIKGTISVSYEMNENKLLNKVFVTVPSNTEAEIKLPKEMVNCSTIKLNGEVTDVIEEGLYYTIFVKSGTNILTIGE